MKYLIRITILALVIILWSCLKHQDEERFNVVIGQVTYENIDISLDHGTLEVVGDKMVSNVQVPNPMLRLRSDNMDTIQLDFVFHNMRLNILPTITPERGVLQIGNEPKSIHYSIILLPYEEISIQLTNFPKKDSYKFGVVGDIQNEWNSGEHIAESIKDKDLDFFIHLGDIVSLGNEEEYIEAAELMTKFSVPVYHIVGNHDVSSLGSGFEYYSKYFGKTNYSFSYNSDLFVALDAADQGISRKVFDFGETTLEQQTGENKFVFQHVPPFDDSGIRNNSFSTNFEAARYMNLMIDNDVDVVFAGHVHSYQDFTVSGVRNIIAGIGGGIPEKLDDIGYGYLIVHCDNSEFSVERIDLEKNEI